jgi:hypothetical protein
VTLARIPHDGAFPYLGKLTPTPQCSCCQFKFSCGRSAPVDTALNDIGNGRQSSCISSPSHPLQLGDASLRSTLCGPSTCRRAACTVSCAAAPFPDRAPAAPDTATNAASYSSWHATLSGCGRIDNGVHHIPRSSRQYTCRISVACRPDGREPKERNPSRSIHRSGCFHNSEPPSPLRLHSHAQSKQKCRSRARKGIGGQHGGGRRKSKTVRAMARAVYLL